MAIFTPDYDETSVSFTSNGNNAASFTADHDVTSVSYDGLTDEVKLGGRLIDNEDAYIADITGTRIIINGGSTAGTDANGNSGTWTVGADVV